MMQFCDQKNLLGCPACDREEWEFAACDENVCRMSRHRELASLKNKARKRSKLKTTSTPVAPTPPVWEKDFVPMEDRTPWIPNLPQRRSCPMCGIDTSGPMGYVCNHPNCPTFPRVWCVSRADGCNF